MGPLMGERPRAIGGTVNGRAKSSVVDSATRQGDLEKKVALYVL